jgi:N-acetylglucosaminyldiphosphoundecaprenol N-acetyl-beta-D-mannosaminyltransferase
MEKVRVLGVNISTVSKAEAIKAASDFLNQQARLHTIFTPNPEMLVKARKDAIFREVLNAADLSLCDGFGLYLACRGVCERITGVDFMLNLCELAQNRGERIFLLGSGSEEVLEKTKKALLENFPRLQVVGMNPGPKLAENSHGDLHVIEDENNRLIDEVKAANPSIIFVAFGMGKQEKWIAQYAPKVPSLRLAMGVGGAFDFVSGNIPRAPRLLRNFGLEWLYRLVKQPERIGRIFNATARFVFLVLTSEKTY